MIHSRLVTMNILSMISIMILGFMSHHVTTFGQASIVRSRLQSLAMGKTDEAKRDLPDLLAEYPDDPGVLFLHASVLEDMSKSLVMYQKIVKETSDCEWADDAQLKIVLYHAMKRDTAKAREEMQVFRATFPKSEFLLAAHDLLRATVGAAPRIKPQTGIKPDKIKTDKPDTTNDEPPKKLETMPPQIPPKEPTKIGKDVLFTLKVGVFKTKPAAEEEYRNYKSKRMKVDLSDNKLPDGSIRYVLTIGEYSSRKNAEAGIALVKDICNCTPLIIPKLDQ